MNDSERYDPPSIEHRTPVRRPLIGKSGASPTWIAEGDGED